MHEGEEDKGDMDVGPGVNPMWENYFFVKILSLSSCPGEVTEQLFYGCLGRELLKYIFCACLCIYIYVREI